MTLAEITDYNNLTAEEWKGTHHATNAALGETEAQAQAKLALMRSRKATRSETAEAAATTDKLKWAQYKV